jgi:RHS repeat-associated protein
MWGLGFNFASYHGNGNVAGLASGSDGSINAVYEYGPFGEGIRVTSSLAKTNLTIRFSTKYMDDESELAYYGYRYYKLSMGIWIRRDSAGERGGLNLYGFCRNSPIESIDVLGLNSATDVHEVWSGKNIQWFLASFGGIGKLFIAAHRFQH